MGKILCAADCFEVRSNLQKYLALMTYGGECTPEELIESFEAENHLEVCAVCNNYHDGLLLREEKRGNTSSDLADKVLRLPKG